MLHGVEAGGDAFALALAPIRHRTGVADQGFEGGLDGGIVEDLPDLVGADQLAAVALAHAHGVGEGVQVAGGLPDGGVHDDGGVEAFHVLAVAHHEAPPTLLDVALQFAPQRTVVPEAGEAAIDFRTLENEPAPLAQRHQRIQRTLRGLFLVHG